MSVLNRLVAAIWARHWAHKGEILAHLTYLSATFIEGHGIHAMAAGGVAFFLLASLSVAEHVAVE